MRLVISLFTLFLFCIQAPSALAGAYLQVSLPKGVSIELPKNFKVLSGNQRITLEAYAEAVQRRVLPDAQTSPLPFAANLYDGRGRTIAMVNVQYQPESKVTQADARMSPAKNADVVDGAVRSGISQAAAQAPWRVVRWGGTKARTINGVMTYISRYWRTSAVRPVHFHVRLVRVFAGPRSFTLTASHMKTPTRHLDVIVQHIIASLKVQ